MARIDELKEAISEMTDDQLKEFYNKVRSDRRVSKRAKRTIPKTKRQQSKATLAKLVEGMTPEEKQRLLLKLQGTGGAS